MQRLPTNPCSVVMSAVLGNRIINVIYMRMCITYKQDLKLLKFVLLLCVAFVGNGLY